MIADTMKYIFKMDVILPGLKALLNPSQDDLKRCKDLGRDVATKIKESKE